jgi:cell volume regulation protein A
MDASSEIILVGGLLLLLSVFAGLVSARLGVPLLLAFLGLGMTAGEDGPGHIHFSNFQIAYLIGSAALALILFDGGITTKWQEVRRLVLPSALLATLGVAITAGIVGAAAHYGYHIPWLEALLIGAVVAPTDAAAVASLLHMQNLHLRTRVGAILEVESGLNDPMAVFLTLLLVQHISHPLGPGWASGVGLFAQQMIGGAIFGLVGGRVLLLMFRRLSLSTSLYPILGLAGALTIFGGAQLVEASGFLATYLAALILGNGVYPGRQAVGRFFGSFAWLSQIILFLMLGLLVTPHSLHPYAASAIGVAAVLIFVARPLAVAVCLVPFRIPWREILFISWVGLRGAVPIFLAIIPMLIGASGGILLFGTAFIVVLVSLLIQGWTVAPLARWLRLDVRVEGPRAKLDIDLPESLARSGSIVGYRIESSSPAVGYTPNELPLPPGTDILLTVRDGAAFGRGETISIAPEDYVLVWGKPQDAPILDGLLSPRDDRTGAAPSGAFGEFAFPGSTPLSAILSLYDQKQPRRPFAGSAGEYLKVKIGRPRVGDRIRLGAIELIIREVDGEEVSSVAVEVDPEGERKRLSFWPLRPRVSISQPASRLRETQRSDP